MALGPYILPKAEEKQLDGFVGSVVPQNSTLGQLIAHRKIVVKGNYKFSRDGGAVGTITLKDEYGDPITLPAGLIVKDGLIIAKTGLTSGGSPTFDIGIAGGAEFKSGMALTAVDADDEAALIIPVSATASTAVVCTAGVFSLKIITAAVTAGELDVYLEGYYRE